MMTRRELVLGALAVRPRGLLIDTHIHLFDPNRFPYHRNATYKPPAQPLEAYVKFIKQAGIDHTIIVHPEPYQDDHRYLEYCFAHEPSPGFFKGTCLFDPIAPSAPARMEVLARKLPNRIVALRIHENHAPGTRPTTSGAIRDRDLAATKPVWKKAHELGMAIQMHFIPYYGSQIGALAAEFPETPVILDHLARAGQGKPEEYTEVLKLAKYPKVYMKYSAVNYSSKEKPPYRDAKPIVRRAYDAFGPDRMIWGGLGHDMQQFEVAVATFDEMFDFASESDRAKIRGLTAKGLFKF